MHRLGIDLGGTKIEIIALDETGNVRLRHRKATPAGDYPGTLRTIASMVEDAEKDLGSPCTIGIGTPGALSRATGCLKNSNSTCLNGRPLLRDLQTLLHRDIAMANDADCFALSEATDGSAANARVVFGVILGTGVGAGIVVHGQLLSGPNSIAGEWGHNPLPWAQASERPGPECYCGHCGCIETFLSGPGLTRSHCTAAARPAEWIVEQARNGDPACDASLRLYEDRLARSLAHVINILDPDVIVLGGGLSKCERLYEAVPARWGRYVFSDRVDTSLLPPAFGDSSGVRGAAWLGGGIAG